LLSKIFTRDTNVPILDRNSPMTVFKSSTPAGKHTVQSSETKTLTVKPQSNLGCIHQTPGLSKYCDDKTLEKSTQPLTRHKCLLFYKVVNAYM
jgi:hypothetical protein